MSKKPYFWYEGAGEDLLRAFIEEKKLVDSFEKWAKENWGAL